MTVYYIMISLLNATKCHTKSKTNGNSFSTGNSIIFFDLLIYRYQGNDINNKILNSFSKRRRKEYRMCHASK